MRKHTLIKTLTTIIVSLLLSTFSIIATAQNYYPAEIGNEWILDRTDGNQRQTYTLEIPEDDADKELILLKIETKNLNTNNVVDTDKYYLSDSTEGIKLHKTNIQAKLNNIVFTASANLPTPAIFFPRIIRKDEEWDIVTDAKLSFLETELEVKSTTNLKVITIENVQTPVGTFQNCAKIELKLSISGVINTQSISYQWLAPGVGPVKFESSDGDIYEITSFKRSPPPILPAQNPPVWRFVPNNITVTGTRLGDILNARILENVEDYVSEPDKLINLGIESVTGNIVQPGDGTGFATNLLRKQDLWVAGIFENAPIIGSITLFAENSKGKTTQIINVRINASQ